MTPRWTIGQGPILVWIDGSVLPVPDTGVGDEEAYDALVAAVRDADTLRQARELAERILRFQRTGHGVDAANTVDDLVDLLSPAPQGEGTDA